MIRNKIYRMNRNNETTLNVILLFLIFNLLFINILSSSNYTNNNSSVIISNISKNVNITIYWGAGCPHCAKTINAMDSLGLTYTKKEVYGNLENRRELSDLYVKYNVTNMNVGVPTILINNGKVSCLVLGEIGTDGWKLILNKINSLKPGACYSYDLIKYLKTAKVINKQTTPTLKGGSSGNTLTWSAIIVAAASDSINPCTIAIMTMLLATILIVGGSKKAIIAGLVFSGTIYIMYMLMGFGIITAIASPALQKYFLAIVTIGALAMAVTEINSYFNYKPGFSSLEMPMFLRPYAKKILDAATSIPGVIVAALFCSVFLLPCSSGPYLTILALVAKEASAKHIMYLAVYNLIFILPLLLITVIIGSGFSTPEKVNKLKNKYIKYMHLAAGILMLLLFILLLIETLSIWNIIPQTINQV